MTIVADYSPKASPSVSSGNALFTCSQSTVEGRRDKEERKERETEKKVRREGERGEGGERKSVE